MLKGLITKLLAATEQPQPKEKQISPHEIEAIVEAKIKEHAATLEKPVQKQDGNEEDYSLTDKQIAFALSLIEKVKDYQLATEPANLTLKDLNKLIAYNKFRNKGILVNLEKKGVIKRK